MSKRLQVLLDEAEFEAIQKLARRSRQSVAEWVRQALREARGRAPRRSATRKLEAVRGAVQHEFPSGDVAEMLRVIESGYLGAKE